MITSMCQRELFVTLMGYDVRCGRHVKISDPSTVDYSKEYMCVSTTDKSGGINEKWVAYDPKALNVPRRQPSEIVDISHFDTFTYSNAGDFKIDNSTPSLVNFDRTEFSDNTKAEEVTFEPYECTDAINFSGDDFGLTLISGIPGLIPTEERIAEVFGSMAKRLDDAYSKGKFTEDEYNELNDMIAKGMEQETARAERAKAFKKVIAEHMKIYNTPYSASSPDLALRRVRESIMSPEQFLAYQEAKVTDYVKKFCQYDRSAILNMFNSVRYGK